MIKKPPHLPTYTPERINELVDRMALLRLRWLISVKSRSPNNTEKVSGRLSDRLAKMKDWSRRRDSE